MIIIVHMGQAMMNARHRSMKTHQRKTRYVIRVPYDGSIDVDNFQSWLNERPFLTNDGVRMVRSGNSEHGVAHIYAAKSKKVGKTKRTVRTTIDRVMMTKIRRAVTSRHGSTFAQQAFNKNYAFFA